MFNEHILHFAWAFVYFRVNLCVCLGQGVNMSRASICQNANNSCTVLTVVTQAKYTNLTFVFSGQVSNIISNDITSEFK